MTRTPPIFALLLAFSLILSPGCKKLQLPFGKKNTPEEAQSAEAAAASTPAGDSALPPPPKPEIGSEEAAAPASAPAGSAPAAATAANAAAKPQFDQTANVMVLCYHRFEPKPKDGLAITAEEFDRQLGALKENGFSVIPMQDFLAWRRGEKEIPKKSCVITIDDGYRSGYEAAWPLLKKHGYPFTMFVYTNYVKGQPKSGGQSLSWEELAEMRDAGVDIQSHTVSHEDLRSKRGASPEQYTAWLKNEMCGSKQMLEERLGIRVNAIAYPYGLHNQAVRDMVKQCGFEAGFTVYGQRLTWHAPAEQQGRYAVDSKNPKVFDQALQMVGGGVTSDSSGPAVAQLAAASMITQPLNGETIKDATPTIKANLATMGDIDPASVEVRVSGYGALPAQYDAATKMVTTELTQKLRPGTYTVIISAKAGGRKSETRWSFTYQP